MELTVISGKGGTGKTTIALALSELAKNTARADCDVDAPNMYLFYDGKNVNQETFYGEKTAVVQRELCVGCKTCESTCKFDAIKDGEVNAFKCEGCGACVLVCPQEAITLTDMKTADMFITEVSNGVISRAKMEIGSEGSGRLITQLRKNLKQFPTQYQLTIVDGSPGIGCPVISSITGSDAVLVVTEPTKSGLEDLKRVVELCGHFKIFTLVCLNKYDINEKVAFEIEEYCGQQGIPVVGKIPYDDTVMESINQLKPIVYFEDSKSNQAIRRMWKDIQVYINKNSRRNKYEDSNR